MPFGMKKLKRANYTGIYGPAIPFGSTKNSYSKAAIKPSSPSSDTSGRSVKALPNFCRIIPSRRALNNKGGRLRYTYTGFFADSVSNLEVVTNPPCLVHFTCSCARAVQASVSAVQTEKAPRKRSMRITKHKTGVRKHPNSPKETTNKASVVTEKNLSEKGKATAGIDQKAVTPKQLEALENNNHTNDGPSRRGMFESGLLKGEPFKRRVKSTAEPTHVQESKPSL